MNRYTLPLILLIAVGAFFVGTIASSSRAQPVTGQQWEYLVYSAGQIKYFDTGSGEFVDLQESDWYDQAVEILTENNLRDSEYLALRFAMLGADGWELSTHLPEDRLTIFKRLKPAN